MTLLAVVLVCAAAVSLVLVFGLYNVAGNLQHLQPAHAVLEFALRQSVRVNARDIDVPPLSDPATVDRGALCYQQKCLQCHGGPGVAAADFGQAMQPLPGPLIDATQRWHARELYWITRNGLKMTGMPAWEHRLSERDLWSVVAFLQELPQLSPQQFASRLGVHTTRAERCEISEAAPSRLGNAERGKRALYAYACVGCHTVAGTVQSNPQIGPPLDGMARRTRIAGVLDNTRDNMVHWLRETETVKPGTAMPAMNVGEQDAHDIAAYLSTLK
ncbi:c-type cytochrome [Comamonas terrigena]|uniref:c-type cytochrome n=1 Tax=Comamonas terrigena TaxID=32013 RepID=UPI00289A54F4|nr:c-type cytochrome [Comamonas terrigena]